MCGEEYVPTGSNQKMDSECERKTKKERHKKFSEKNPQYHKEYQRSYRKSEKAKQWISEYRQSLNYKIHQKERNKKQIDNLSDSYILAQCKAQGINPKPEIIEQKRLSIKLKRIIYEKQRQINAQ